MAKGSRTIYIESLDSVRFDRKEVSARDMALAKAHAESELLICLLLGMPIALSENQALDSAGTMDILDRALEGWRMAKERNEQPESESPLSTPFQLFLYKGLLPAGEPKHSRFRGTLSALIGRQGFILSSLPDLTSQTDRDAASRALLSGKTGSATLNDVFGQEYRERIDRLTAYFDATLKDKGATLKRRRAGVPPESMASILHWFKDVDLNELEQLTAAGATRVASLQEVLNAMEQSGVNLNSRSQVRHAARQLEPSALRGGMYAIADSAYNRSLVTSLGSEDSVFGSGISAGNPYVNTALALLEERETPDPNDREVNIGIQVEVDPSLASKVERGIPWRDVWELLENDDWINRVNELHSVRFPQTLREFEHADEVFRKHIHYVASHLPSSAGKVIAGESKGQRYFRYVREFVSEAAPVVAASTGAGLVLNMAGMPIINVAATVAAETALVAAEPHVRAWRRRGSWETALHRSTWIGINRKR